MDQTLPSTSKEVTAGGEVTCLESLMGESPLEAAGQWRPRSLSSRVVHERGPRLGLAP